MNHRFQIGDNIAFERADGRRVGRVVAWYDDWSGNRTYVAEVPEEMADYSSDGRWHVSELAARPVRDA